MPSKKVKKFCRVTKFLEQTDKDLYQALDDLCLFGLFRTRGRGVTFLYPTDKSYRKKIIDHAYSNTPEKAVDMIKALVLLDYLPSPTDFKNKKDDIPNALHKKLEVDSADAKEVKLKSGHKLEVDKSFAPLRSGEPVAVYKISGKDELPLTGAASTMKYNNNKSKGGYRGGSLEKSDEVKLTECVERIYESGQSNIYMTVMSLIYEYAANKADIDVKKLIHKRICASARASFYNIVAPWSLEKDYNISKMIRDADLVSLVECNQATVASLITSWGTQYTAKLTKLIEEAVGVIEKSVTEPRDKKREDLIKDIKTPTEARTKVLDAYEGDSSRLYKDLLTVYCYLAAINEAEDPSYFTNSFTFVMKHVFNHSNSFSESVNETVYNLSIYYNLIKSDAFLYIPVSDKSQIDTAYADKNSILPDPNDESLFTIQFNTDLVSKFGGGSDTFFGGIVGGL
jgi:hypothetical protein